MAWGNITSDAASPATYGSTTGFNDANSGIDWRAAAKTLGAGSENSDTSRNAGTIPTLAPPQIQIQNAPAGRPRTPMNIQELLKMLYEHQNLYQQGALAPAAGPPQVPPRPPGLLGI